RAHEVMRTARSHQLFSRALQILPGGVDSPVRAFKAVGCEPLFIRRASGSRIEDADGHEYIDYVMSWGPLIHGHAPRGLVAALAAAAKDGTSLGAPSPLEVEPGERVRAAAVTRVRAPRQLGHRGGDERGPRRARGDRARPHPEI